MFSYVLAGRLSKAESTHWVTLEGSRVFWSVKLSATDRRLVAAPRMLHVTSRRVSGCGHTVLHLDTLTHFACVQQCAVTVSGWSRVIITL